jgi:hypothetical protein
MPHFVLRKEYRKAQRRRSFDLDPELTIAVSAEQIERLGGRHINHFRPETRVVADGQAHGVGLDRLSTFTRASPPLTPCEQPSTNHRLDKQAIWLTVRGGHVDVAGNSFDSLRCTDLLLDLQLGARFKRLLTLEDHIPIGVEERSGEHVEPVIPVAGLAVESVAHAEPPACREFLGSQVVGNCHK